MDGGIYSHVVKFINLYWGDVGAIDNAINNVWTKEGNRSTASIGNLDKSLGKLTSPDSVSYWEGNARDAYVNWRNDFKSNTLDRYHQNVWAIKVALDNIVGTLKSIRAHIIAMVIELAATMGAAATSNPVGYGAAALAGLALLGTWIDYELRVKNDLDNHGRELETIRDRDRLDRGGGNVSAPFKTDIIGDWDNWQHKNPERLQ
ncbi:MAG: hypothetical protein ACJ72W_15015 [Actinoallomurus sp.]